MFDNLRNYVFVRRGQLRSLWVGVLIAVPSGAGVALSLLGGNTGSLVGVAILASLLPPAVNAVRSLFTIISRKLSRKYVVWYVRGCLQKYQRV